jgi:hypothetical protein
MFDFLHCFIGWLERETGYGPVDQSAGVLWIVREPFFLEAVTLSNAIDDSRRVAICGPCEIRMVLDHMRTEHGKHVVYWSDFPLHGEHRFESPRLSDVSNCLFVAVIT